MNEKAILLQKYIEEYLRGKGKPTVNDLLSLEHQHEELGVITPIHKVMIQQIIREKLKQQGKDIDNLIRVSRKENQEGYKEGQVLGSISALEAVYIDYLLREKKKKKTGLASYLW